jgi:hypothetical protein
MATKHGAAPGQPDHAGRADRSDSGPSERHRLIQEAAYSLYERGGFVHGHDMDDWLAAEAYVDGLLSQGRPRTAAPRTQQELQQSAPRSVARGAVLERISRQHPLRDPAQSEGMDALDAPRRSR